MSRKLPISLRRRWRILLPLILLILGCGPTPQPLQGNVITLLGHTDTMQPGASITLPILVQDVNSRRPAANVQIDVGIGPDLAAARPLFSQRTGEDGMVLAQFTVPADLADPQQFLIVRSDKALFTMTGNQLSQSAYSQPVHLGPATSLLVSTDKPRYQPGQTLHTRVLALDKLSLHPAAGQTVRVRIQEPGGVWLTDQSLTLSDWGIAALDLPLDQRAASGDYRIVATVGPMESSRTVTVEPYTLPRFQVNFETDAPYTDIDGTVQARISAAYFFGKPVAGAQVALSGPHLASQSGVTDDAGGLEMEFAVPDFYFDTLEQGTERMELTVQVTDAAGHMEEVTEEVLLTADPLLINAVAESGYLRLGLQNTVYLEVSQPDGAPIQASLVISSPVLAQTQAVETDAFGLAQLQLTPTDSLDLPLRISAMVQGEAGPIQMEQTIRLGVTSGQSALLLRPDRAEYQVGETIQVEILASGDVRTVYLDLSKEGQTVDLQALTLHEGRAVVEIPADGSLLGVLEINGYALAGGGVISDRRLALINPGSLELDVTTDALVYRPGDTAQLTVQSRFQGAAVPAALGVTIVDESLYAVEKMDPGFARTYFLLREEMRDPPYRVKGFAPFDEKTPAPDLPAGIRTAANHALLGALAQELGRSQSGARLAAAQLAELTPEPVNPLLAMAGGWSMKLALALPLLGIGLWDGRKRLWPNLLIVAVLAGLSLLWVSCAAPMAAPSSGDAAPAAQAPARESAFGGATTATQQGSGEVVRLRQFFPETLFWLPEALTDDQGRIQLSVPLADTITTWRVGVVASTQTGLLGSAQADLRVFQDFFVEPDLPLNYVAGDELDVRVSLFNYLDQPQDIELTVEGGDWLAVRDEARVQTVQLEANQVTSATVPIRLLQPGVHTLRFTARGSRMSDSVARELQVTPAGREVTIPFQGILARSLEENFTVSALTAEQDQELTLRLYGSQAASYAPDIADTFYRDQCPPYDQVWLAVLKAEYLQVVDQWTPQQQLLTQQFLQRAYLRMLRFYDATNRGFYGGCFLLARGPADVVGTARALTALLQMNILLAVDPALIEQTQDHLMANQNADGSWLDRSDYYYWQDDAQLARQQTGEILWRLSEAGFAKSEAVQKGLAFLAASSGQNEPDPGYGGYEYVLNARLLADPGDAQALALLAARIQERSSPDSGFWGIEPYALAALRAVGFRDEAQQLLAHMNRPQGASYYYGSTTDVMALLALTEDARNRSVTPDATIRVQVNDQEVADFEITPQNANLLQSRVITGALAALNSGENVLQLRLRGDHVSYYEAQWRYFVPWQRYGDLAQGADPLLLTVEYAAERVKAGQLLAVTAILLNRGQTPTDELILDLTLPAGFRPLSGDFEQMDAQGLIRDYVEMPGRMILRLAPLDIQGEAQLTFHVVADFTGQVQIPTSRVYESTTPGQVVLAGADGFVLVE